MAGAENDVLTVTGVASAAPVTVAHKPKAAEPDVQPVVPEAAVAEAENDAQAEEQAARRERLRLSALRLLQRREYSRCELERRLSRRKRADAEDDWLAESPATADALIESVLDDLQQAGLQSDRRFAESLIRSRAERGYGPLWIRSELQQRGVPSNLTDTAFAEGEINWVRVLQDLYERRYGGRDPSTAAEFQKRKRFLLNRGFPAEQVHRVCRDGVMTDNI